jgi:hypothetical protein
MNRLVEQDILRMLDITYYKLGKTISENLMEQPDSKMPFQIEKFGYKQGDVSTLGPALKRQEEHFREINDLLSDPHKVLTALSIGFTILGAIPSPLSPILLGLGVAADVADAALYYKEGDPHMGTIMLALAVIPGGEFIKATKNTIPIGPFKSLIKKAKEGISKLTPTEIKQLKKYFDNFTKYADEVGQVFTYQTANKLIKKLPNLLSKVPVSASLYVSLFILKTIKFLTVMTVKIGATVVGADAVYYYFEGNTTERAANIKKVKQVYELIKKYYKGNTMAEKSANAKKDINKQLLKQMEDPKIQEAFNQQFNKDFNMEELLKVMEEQGVDTTSTQVDTTSTQ